MQNVRHLMKHAHNFLSFTELKDRLDVKTNFVVYHGLVSCIKRLRNAIQNQNETNRNLTYFVEKFIKAPKSNRLAYKKLVSRVALGELLGTTAYLVATDPLIRYLFG